MGDTARWSYRLWDGHSSLASHFKSKQGEGPTFVCARTATSCGDGERSSEQYRSLLFFLSFFLSFSLSLTPISFSSIISPIIDFEFDSILIIYQTRVETSIGKIDRIITSPFLRCLETARPLSLSLNLPLLVDYSLFEGELISLTTLRTNSSRIISSYTQIILLGSLFC